MPHGHRRLPQPRYLQAGQLAFRAVSAGALGHGFGAEPSNPILQPKVLAFDELAEGDGGGGTALRVAAALLTVDDGGGDAHWLLQWRDAKATR